MKILTLLKDEEYLKLSRLFYSPVSKIARLFSPNPGTAELLKRADLFRVELQLLEYKQFCNTLSELTFTPQPFSVNGKSADWIAVYQFINNDRAKVQYLYQLLEKIQQPIQLPISRATIENLEDVNDQVKREFIDIGLTIQYFSFNQSTGG